MAGRRIGAKTEKMKGRKLRDVGKEFEELYKTMDAKKLKISEKGNPRRHSGSQERKAPAPT